MDLTHADTVGYSIRNTTEEDVMSIRWLSSESVSRLALADVICSNVSNERVVDALAFVQNNLVADKLPANLWSKLGGKNYLGLITVFRDKKGSNGIGG